MTESTIDRMSRELGSARRWAVTLENQLAWLVDELDQLIADRHRYDTAGDLAGRVKVLLLQLEDPDA